MPPSPAATKPFALAVHGGAGTILRSSLTPEKEAAYRAALTEALRTGEALLKTGGTALDAVTAAVKSLEDCPLFNAGRGSVFTHNKTHEADAAIMDGSNLTAGAVAGVTGIVNPVLAARRVMEASGHVLLAGRGAEEFARLQGLAFAEPSYFFTEQRMAQLLEIIDTEGTMLDHAPPASQTQAPAPAPENGERNTDGNNNKFGTVGAVALDRHGNLAASTSTGGMTNKRYGRIGDSPLIGAGTYADNQTCAVSATGYGEFFIRYVVAHEIASLVRYAGLSLAEAAHKVIMEQLAQACPDSGGVIAINQAGQITMPFNSEGMYRGSINTAGELFTGIYGE